MTLSGCNHQKLVNVGSIFLSLELVNLESSNVYLISCLMTRPVLNQGWQTNPKRHVTRDACLNFAAVLSVDRVKLGRPLFEICVQFDRVMFTSTWPT